MAEANTNPEQLYACMCCVYVYVWIRADNCKWTIDINMIYRRWYAHQHSNLSAFHRTLENEIHLMAHSLCCSSNIETVFQQICIDSCPSDREAWSDIFIETPHQTVHICISTYSYRYRAAGADVAQWCAGCCVPEIHSRRNVHVWMMH